MAQATPFSPSLVKSEEGTTKPKSLGLKSLLFSFFSKKSVSISVQGSGNSGEKEMKNLPFA